VLRARLAPDEGARLIGALQAHLGEVRTLIKDTAGNPLYLGRGDRVVLLCSFHHRLIHDHPYRLKRDDGVLKVWRANGEQVTAQRPLDAVPPIVSAFDPRVERHVEHEAIVPTWAGEPMDLDAILAAIAPHTPVPEPDAVQPSR
jgi:hypothetical protein